MDRFVMKATNSLTVWPLFVRRFILDFTGSRVFLQVFQYWLNLSSQWNEFISDYLPYFLGIDSQIVMCNEIAEVFDLLPFHGGVRALQFI